MQPGSGSFSSTDQAGTLTDFQLLVTSPRGAMPALGTVRYNEVDAGVATVKTGIAWSQGYLPARQVTAPKGSAAAKVGDEVFKIGRTTGLTHGVVTSVSAVVGPVPYAPGDCWFRRSITIDGKDGTLFSDHGDSGSAVVDKLTGEILGLVYAGNGSDSFACPIDAILATLNCQIA